MKKGLRALSINYCSLDNNDLEFLPTSLHTESLQRLYLYSNKIVNDSKDVGLITLCQKLKKIVVLSFGNCTLHTLSPESVSQLVKSLCDCNSLKVLQLKENQFSQEITNLIIEGLAHSKSLRYLDLTFSLPGWPRRNGRLNEEEINIIKSLV